MMNSISWEEDYQSRVVSLEELTLKMRRAVPILNFVNFHVDAVEDGYARTCLPVSHEATNQHMTHQASLLVTLADYTGGIALGTLFRGYPILGIHTDWNLEAASLWLAHVEIEYYSPSTEKLIAVSSVPAERREKIYKRFMAGRRVMERLMIEFRNGDKKVAQADCLYFAQQLRYLMESGYGAEIVNSHRRKACVDQSAKSANGAGLENHR